MWGTERRHRRLATALLAFGHAANAQAPIVSDTDIEQAKRLQPSVTDADMQRARERHRMPTEAELRRVPVPSTPKIEALPQPTGRTPVDLEALAKGFSINPGQSSLTPMSGPTLLVFVSFAMPEPALARLVEQAERAKGSLILRGLVDGSLVNTVARVQQLIGSRRVAVQIDPLAFDRYAVTQTPSFVLVRDGVQPSPCASGVCIPSDGFVMAAGDVSLDYALAYLRRSKPAFSKDADAFLKRLKVTTGAKG